MKTAITFALFAVLHCAIFAQTTPPSLDDYQPIGLSPDGKQALLVNLKSVTEDGRVVGFSTILAGVKGRDTDGTYIFDSKAYLVNSTKYNCDSGEFWITTRRGFWNGERVDEEYEKPVHQRLAKDSALKWAGERACVARFGVRV